MFLVSSCSFLSPIYWSHVLSWEWRCSWSSANRRCSNYIWVINNLIVHKGAPYIRDLTVFIILAPCRVVKRKSRSVQLSNELQWLHLNSLWPSDAIWRQRSGSTLAQVMACCPDGTKPLPEPMLTDHQWSPVTFILGQFHKRSLNNQSLKSVWKLHV